MSLPLRSFFYIPGVSDSHLMDVNASEPTEPSSSVDSLPPIYRSVDGGIYYANKRALMDKTVAKGEEFEYLDLSVFKLNLGHRLSSLKAVDETFFDSDEERLFTQELVKAIVSDQTETLKTLILTLSTELADDVSRLLSIRLYRGMTLFHCCVLFITEDAIRLDLMSLLASLGACDGIDHLGSTAAMRAMQAGVSIPDLSSNGTEVSGVSPFFHPYQFYQSKTESLSIDTMDQSEDLIQNTLNRDISINRNANCEIELLFYLYLFLPTDFSARAYNQRFLEISAQKMPFSLHWDKPLPNLSVMPHLHSDLGATHYGLFSESALESGRIVTIMNGFYQFAVKEDCQIETPRYESYVSNYGFYFLPLHDVAIDYYDVLLFPSVNILPELNAHPVMFINDSGQAKTANVTWIHLFINGLPMILFVTMAPICAGFECLTDYIQENPVWASQREIEKVEIPFVPHPFFSE